MDSQVEFWQNLEKNASQIMIFLPIYKMWGRKMTKHRQSGILYIPLSKNTRRMNAVNECQREATRDIFGPCHLCPPPQTAAGIRQKVQIPLCRHCLR